jgi:hypothetical protein
MGAGGRDTESHQLSVTGKRQRHFQAGMKRRDVFDQMVRRQHQQDRVLGLGKRLARRQRDGRRSVAPHRLQQDAGLFHAQLAQLLGHQEAMLLIADQLRQRDVGAFQPRDGLLQHRQVCVGQAQELLGVQLPRKRPQARPRTACHDHG